MTQALGDKTGIRRYGSCLLPMDDALAEAHTSQAAVSAAFDWDWAAAETGYERAKELNCLYEIQELLSRIRWDPEFGDAAFRLGYYDRVADQVLQVPLRQVWFEPDDHFDFYLLDQDGEVLNDVVFTQVSTAWGDDATTEQVVVTVGITYGTYDLFHIGHLRLLERSRALCDRLVLFYRGWLMTSLLPKPGSGDSGPSA